MDIVLKGLGGVEGLDNEYAELLLMAIQIAKGEISVNFGEASLARLEELNQAMKKFRSDSMTEADIALMHKLVNDAN